MLAVVLGFGGLAGREKTESRNQCLWKKGRGLKGKWDGWVQHSGLASEESRTGNIISFMWVTAGVVLDLI